VLQQGGTPAQGTQTVSFPILAIKGNRADELALLQLHLNTQMHQIISYQLKFRHFGPREMECDFQVDEHYTLFKNFLRYHWIFLQVDAGSFTPFEITFNVQ